MIGQIGGNLVEDWWNKNARKNEKQTTGNNVLYLSTYLMARQKYSDEQIDFISDQLETTKNTKSEIAEKFIKAFLQSGRKIENIKQKITKMATEKGVDLKDCIRGEAEV